MRVLVCDDHSLFREGLRLLLEKLDPSMEVTLTGSAEDAVAATRDAMFDLILLDWHMDGLAGERALEALRGNSNKLIARQLGISDGTVKTHLRAIYQELGTRNRTEAVYMAAEHGVRIS